MIRDASVSDAQAIVSIYNHYIRESIATFEEVELGAQDMADRIQAVQAAGLHWLVLVEDERLVGYAYAANWHRRSAYRHSVEVSVYLAADVAGKGWGSRLYDQLFARLRDNDVHVVIGGISLPNPASVALHEKFGMVQAAHYKEVGRKFGRWLDVGYWQVILDP